MGGLLRWDVPIEEVAAGDIAAGDVVRLDDPQALRVECVARDDAGVVLELRPVVSRFRKPFASRCRRTGSKLAPARPRIEPAAS